MKIFKIIILIFLFLVLGLGYFSYTMNKTYVYDENMYIASGILIQNFSLYKDFTYLQMPYQPMIFGLVYKLTGNSYYYMIGRIIQCISILISIGLMFLITNKMTRDFIISIFIVLIFGFNGVIIWTLGYINNSVIPIVFALLAVYFYLLYTYREDNSRGSNIWGLLFCGVFLAIAAGIKLFYASLILPILLTAIVFPLPLKLNIKLKKQLLPITIGFIIGLIPVLYYLISDFDAFIFNNFEYHTLNTLWRKQLFNEDIESFMSKIRYFINTAIVRSSIIIVICFFFLIISASYFMLRNKLNYKNFFFKKEIFLLFSLTIISTITALTPAPLWIHYFALPIPFVVLLLGALLNNFFGKSKTIIISIFTLFTLAAVYFGSGNLFEYAKKINKPKEWLTVNFHETAVSASNMLKENGIKGKVVTYHPLFALEGGYDIPKEFSSTIFSVRIRNFLSKQERYKYNIIPYSDLTRYFDNTPPAVFYIGGIANFDNQIFEYVKTHHYRQLEENFEYFDIYFRDVQ